MVHAVGGHGKAYNMLCNTSTQDTTHAVPISRSSHTARRPANSSRSTVKPTVQQSDLANPSINRCNILPRSGDVLVARYLTKGAFTQSAVTDGTALVARCVNAP